VHELLRLCKSLEYVSLCIKHNDDVDFIEFVDNGNALDDGHSDCKVDDEYEKYGSNVEDEDARTTEKNKADARELVVDLE